jgi:hypothetical protein
MSRSMTGRDTTSKKNRGNKDGNIYKNFLAGASSNHGHNGSSIEEDHHRVAMNNTAGLMTQEDSKLSH